MDRCWLRMHCIGVIPLTIGTLSNLLALCLAGNSFNSKLFRIVCYVLLCSILNEGVIPSTIGYLIKLTDIELGYNCLSGSLVLELICDLYIHIACWRVGSIPTNIGSLTSLVYLNMYANSLSGNVLWVLELYNIWLLSNLGAFPSTIGSLTAVAHMDMGTNQFQGNDWIII